VLPLRVEQYGVSLQAESEPWRFCYGITLLELPDPSFYNKVGAVQLRQCLVDRFGLPKKHVV